MITAIKTLKKKIELNHIGEMTDYKEGYERGLTEALKAIQDTMDELVVPGTNYFVIMYQNGDKKLPYIEELRLYKITNKTRKKYCFSRNPYANQFNTFSSDLILSSGEAIRKRVFLTREQAEEAIS